MFGLRIHVHIWLLFLFFFFFTNSVPLALFMSMNSANRQMHSNFKVNNYLLLLFFIVFNFQQNKQYPNSHSEVSCLRFEFSRFLLFLFFFFFFFTRSWFHVGHRPASGSCSLCTGPTSTLNVYTLVWNGTVSGSRALFMGPTNIFFTKTLIKNWSHSTVHTFKYYFATMFSVFNKISYI